ncbi:rhomboid family intramembrane serine protease [Streptacidiphilus jiangxiensis]|uniref:Membrane associated serine protease, rhomboid family n=1 Tax=Streptacidiphilus jiangxiensis TaxID=235985 RepID=A0A1H7JFC2_STRJI|nr:rhomboid family intramembrane serine protease [Streptacidiphilus jiangxiensis]SEK72660.1 Membrane associated serine protease, rhomboid family [Streptacidiphilus jiangxiensis]
MSDCYRHPGRDTGVHCARCERPVCPDCRIEAAVGFQCVECVHEGRGAAPARPARTDYGGPVRADGALVTRALIGANLAVWLLVWIGGDDAFYRLAMQGHAVAPGGQWYRLLSSVFLHEPSSFGILHIALNMWSLWILGPYVEAAVGRLRYLVLYLLAGIGGSVLVMLSRPTLIVAGASGAIFGLLGAVVVIHRHRGFELGPIMAVLVVNLVATFSLGFIAWQAHIGGLVVGALLAAGFVYAPAAPAHRRDLVQAAAVVLVAALVAGVGLYAAAHVTG